MCLEMQHLSNQNLESKIFKPNYGVGEWASFLKK
jgi:hypothetical protein